MIEVVLRRGEALVRFDEIVIDELKNAGRCDAVSVGDATEIVQDSIGCSPVETASTFCLEQGQLQLDKVNGVWDSLPS